MNTADGLFCEVNLTEGLQLNVGVIPVGPIPVPVYLAVPLGARIELAGTTTASTSVHGT